MTFNGDWNAFGIATKHVSLKKFDTLYDTNDENVPFYGIFPYWSRKYCNVPEFHAGLKGKFKKGEQYRIAFDPQKSLLSIEGGRLRRRVEKPVKRGVYRPVVFSSSTASDIQVEFY